MEETGNKCGQTWISWYHVSTPKRMVVRRYLMYGCSLPLIDGLVLGTEQGKQCEAVSQETSPNLIFATFQELM